MTHHTMARRRGRPPGLTLARIEKRFIIAEAVLAGIKIAAVARQLGVSRSWPSREANAPGTGKLIAELLELRRERMDALCDQDLDVTIAHFPIRGLHNPDGCLRRLRLDLTHLL